MREGAGREIRPARGARRTFHPPDPVGYQKSRGRIPCSFEEGLDPDFDPAGFVVEIEGEIGRDLPEWISAFADQLHTGPDLTLFLVEHTERVAMDEEVDTFELAERLLRLDLAAPRVLLDRKVLGAWFDAGPEPEARAIARDISERNHESPWLEARGSPHGFWAVLAPSLAASFEPELELSLTRESMAGNPGLAGPVFRDLCERGEDEELLRLLPLVLSHRCASAPFDPGETLRAAGWRETPGPKEESVLDLLDLARQASGRLGRTPTKAALRELDPAAARKVLDRRRVNHRRRRNIRAALTKEGC